MGRVWRIQTALQITKRRPRLPWERFSGETLQESVDMEYVRVLIGEIVWLLTLKFISWMMLSCTWLGAGDPEGRASSTARNGKGWLRCDPPVPNTLSCRGQLHDGRRHSSQPLYCADPGTFWGTMWSYFVGLLFGQLGGCLSNANIWSWPTDVTNATTTYPRPRRAGWMRARGLGVICWKTLMACPTWCRWEWSALRSELIYKGNEHASASASACFSAPLHQTRTLRTARHPHPQVLTGYATFVSDPHFLTNDLLDQQAAEQVTHLLTTS